MKAAVVGSPIDHSLSPAIWRAAFAQLGLKSWTYDAIDTDEPGLARIVREGGYAGLSVTMPLKHAAARMVDRTVGRTAGAVNTVVFTKRGSEGHNTDVDGVSAALRQVAPQGLGRVAVLGAGGTATAAVLSAIALDAEAIDLVARNAGPATALRERTGNIATFVPWTHAREAIENAVVVVNTTPKHAADELAAGWHGAPYVDVLYDPWPTPLAAAAMSGGYPVVGGLFVLAHQAVRQIELITGKRPEPEALMAAAAVAAG